MTNPLIAPTTNVRLLSNVPLDNTYTDTIKFESLSAQSSYFLGKTKKSYSNLTYQRLTPNSTQWALFLEDAADVFYDCNYVMYQNAGFSSKWFYAFVNEIIYISENCTAITFEIDVMQTWLFDFEIKRSYIERMHVDDDQLGRNVMAENLDYGPRYMTRSQVCCNLLGSMENADQAKPSTDDWYILISTTEDVTEQDEIIEGDKYSGIYQGLRYIAFLTVDDANQWLKLMNSEGKAGAIALISMVPAYLLPSNPGGGVGGKIVVTGDWPMINGQYFQVQINKQDIDGYEPKNNKLFMYPYNYLEVTTLDGNSATFKWEDFDGYETNSIVRFGFKAAFSNDPVVMCYPESYLREENNWEYAMKLTGFPKCSWKYGTFENWLAQNDLSMGLSAISSAMGAGSVSTGAGISGGGAGAASFLTSVGSSIASSFASVDQVHSKPDTVMGANNPGGCNASFGIQNFWFISKNIHWGYARKIDDYLWKFGYRVCATGIPPLSRPYWDYLQMVNPSITGSVPVQDMRKIKSILTSGITFWHTTDVGNYSLNNNEGVPGH